MGMKNKGCSGVSPVQIRMGTEHELEHTSSRRVAMRIACDHLSEFPTYYTALNKMEKNLKYSKR